MPVTNTDAVLWYNVGIFGELGYGIPNPSNDVGSLNHNIVDLVDLLGRNLFHIMNHEDVDLRTPPSINTVTRIHRLYIRASQILGGRAVPSGVPNLESLHVQPGGEVFKVFPVPYFLIKNNMLKRWSGYVMMAITEAMQHTENRKEIEISETFAGHIGQYLTRVYHNMAAELFGKTAADLRDATTNLPNTEFRLTDEELRSYNPAAFFTQTEMIDTVPNLGYVFTEDMLKPLSDGIPVTSLPQLQPWPVNLTDYYNSGSAGNDDATANDHGGAATSRSGASLPNPVV